MLTDSDRGVLLDNGTQWWSVTDEICNVKAFGAKGDGTTDDTTAINNAIAAVPSSGGVLYFPPGVYKCTSLTPFKNPIWVRGAGRVTTKIASTASIGIQIGDGTSTTWSHIKISDLTIAPTGLSPSKALYLKGGTLPSPPGPYYLTRVTLRDVIVDSSGVTSSPNACDGIYADGAILQLSIVDCYVYGGQNGIKIQGAVGDLGAANIQMVRIVDTYVNNPSSYGYCLDVELMMELFIDGCEFDSSILGKQAVRLLGVVGFAVVGSILRHNLAKEAVYVGRSSLGAGTLTAGGVFVGCFFDQASPVDLGITANGTDDIAVVGCTFVRYGSGLSIANTSDSNIGWGILACRQATWSPAIASAPSQALCGNAVNATVAAGTTNFLGFDSPNSVVTDSNIAKTYLPAAGAVRILTVYCVGSQPASGSLMLTVQKNGVDTSLTTTLAAGSSGDNVRQDLDLTHGFSVAQGDAISLKAVNNASAASASIRSFSVQIVSQGGA